MKKIEHVAIIMDGNARWAKEQGKTTEEGHRVGAQVAYSLLPSISRLGIKYLTLYAFSSENWCRPKNEISSLLKLLNQYTTNKIDLLNKHDIRFKVIGDLNKLNFSLRQKIQIATEKTKNNTSSILTIAFSYGGRSEIVNAVNQIIHNNQSGQQIDESIFRQYLYDPEMPDVDMMIRTSGVSRISNFLLWQIAYAELYFIDKYWPEFNIKDLEEALEVYSTRSRNFGMRKEY
ncbi:MAG: di-trans,poly-cis-decaprenylcistransferase [Rickettsiaceae bacterium]|nr:di-trans,poly-cis-decaprenylcistransferase [Rickettsiaceae bacterium]